MKSEVREALACYNEKDLLQYAKEILRKNINTNPALESPNAVKEYLKLRFNHYEHEVFMVLFLDTRHKVIACEEMFNGTIDSASVYPREVVKAALKRNAAALILAHNHPSGVSEPSRADVRITERLKAALDLVGVRVLDHIVVGGDETVSFAERGIL